MHLTYASLFFNLVQMSFRNFIYFVFIYLFLFACQSRKPLPEGVSRYEMQEDKIVVYLDGTLLDSLDVWERVDYLFLEKRDIEMTREYSEALLHMKFLESAKYTIERYSLNETAEEVMEEWMNLSRELYNTIVVLKKGAFEYLY